MAFLLAGYVSFLLFILGLNFADLRQIVCRFLIVDSVKKVTDIVGDIATACQEQSIGIEHVSNAISHMDGITQQNAALVEQVAVSSESIGEQAKDLSESVAFFKTLAADPIYQSAA